MKTTSILGALTALAAAGLAACTGTSEPVCTREAVPGIAVNVREAVTGVALRREVTIVVTADGFKDSVTFAPSAQPATPTWTTASERPGVYRVEVRRPGYGDLVQANVVVDNDRCHVRTAIVTADLSPSNEAWFSYTGPAFGVFETRGVQRVPTDYTRDFATLAIGSVNGVPVSHQVLAVNAGSALLAGGFDDFVFWLNPGITAPGIYGPGDCPEPAEFGGCVRADARFGVPAGGGGSQRLLMSIADSVTVTVVEITPDKLVASFGGRFTFSRPDEAVTRVDVNGGVVHVERTSAP